MDDVPEPVGDPAAEEDPGWPVGFLIATGVAALYLVMRLVQLIAKFVDWLT